MKTERDRLLSNTMDMLELPPKGSEAYKELERHGLEFLPNAYVSGCMNGYDANTDKLMVADTIEESNEKKYKFKGMSLESIHDFGFTSRLSNDCLGREIIDIMEYEINAAVGYILEKNKYAYKIAIYAFEIKISGTCSISMTYTVK